ncbi:DUF6500 family protein [Marinomonas aquiplantarum]|uniref:Catechol 2,3-dioxygenase-like lactoylglutathione lyase family enzyme n=1 Tax=Marinomonas aquiplantarum TaxID=491951 RepID=A0A366D1Y4_9GAMM|nr:catechol 2,3-dioxygenase-like lactoylglutathione lyase family enzyme [Marinomonas aquiplantarum]
MNLEVRQKIISVCQEKIRQKGEKVQVSFYAFFANKNDQPETLMSVARWWIEEHQLNHFEKATKIFAMIKSYQDKKLESSVKGFNHLTLSVKDISRSLDFYENQLGFTAEVRWATGAYLSYGDAWLCLSLCSDEKEEMSVHYTHYAFNIDTASLKAMRDDPALDIWQVNQSEGDSLYVRDPDGHQLEFHLGSLSSRLTSLKETPYQGLEWLS